MAESLDADTFAISTSRPTAPDFTSQCTLVLQAAEDIDQSMWFQILQSPQNAGSIAVVDRTADVIKTAEAISNASFALRGESPYSPRVVLVNEYICDQLLSALATHVSNSKTGTDTGFTSSRSDTEPSHMRRQKGTASTKKANIKDIISGSNGSIVELQGW